MADPSTPNPSDPDFQRDQNPSENSNESSEPKAPQQEEDPYKDLFPGPAEPSDGQPKKLKLKKLLTPLSPHLKAPRPKTDQRIEKEPRSIEIPKAVPVELEPELTPEERQQIAREAGVPFSGEASTAPVEIESSPPTPEELGEVPQPEMGQVQQVESEEPQEVVKKKAPSKRKSKKLPVVLLLPLALLVAILFLIHYLFDPMGFKIEPISERPDISLVNQVEEKTEEAEAQNPGSKSLSLALEAQTVESYLTQLEEQEIVASVAPAGLFINSVFFAEGSNLNPELGLVILSIETEGETPAVVLQDDLMATHRVPLQ